MQAQVAEKPKAAPKVVSEETQTYNRGWAKGKTAGRRKGIVECHEALKKVGKEALCTHLPKIPVALGRDTKESVQKKIAQFQAKLARLKAQEKQFDK